MMRLAINEGRQTRPDIKLGICGEHGGDPELGRSFATNWAWIM
jgi:Phosphoenolpyruvate synthase/pyruvate phosphate dikinase